MQQRIFQLFEHRRIHFHVSTLHFEPRQFPVTLSEVPHRTHVLPKQRARRDHANAHHFTLQVHIQALGLAMHFEEGSALFCAELLDHLAQAALRNHNLSSQIQHVIQFVDVGAQRAVTGARQRIRLSRGTAFSSRPSGYHALRPPFHLTRDFVSEFMLRGSKFPRPSRCARDHRPQFIHGFQQE